MNIRILISDPTDWYKQLGSDVIKYVDNSSGSHCAIAIDVFSGTYVYEAVFPRAKKVPFKDWAKHNYIVKEYHFEIKPEKQYEVYEWLTRQVGKPYFIPQLLLIALLKIIPINIKKLNGRKGIICSELVARFLNQFFGVTFSESYDTIGVRDIEDVCDMLKTNIV